MISINFPTLEHIELIKNLNSKYLIGHLIETQRLKGFIRVEYDRGDLQQIISNKEIVIATNQNSIIGYYLIGRKSEKAVLEYQKEKALTFSYTGNIHFSKIGFGCQVCIEEAYRNNGLFRQLLDVLADAVKEKYSHLLCSVSDENVVSLKTHIRNGWQLIDTFEKTKYFIYNTQTLS